jgi:hypothetical protein
MPHTHRSSLTSFALKLAERTPLLLRPRDAEAKLQNFDALLAGDAPNPWQVQLGVVRMLHRVLFRSESIGTCAEHPVRNTWRARMLHNRAMRLPVLVALRAVAPLDFSGLLSPTWRIQRHLLAAHHDGLQFVYDFELLAASTGALDEVRAHAEEIVSGRDPNAEAWRDVAIFERYHENLIAAIDAFKSGELRLGDDIDNPDLTFFAFLRWCARQPSTANETLQRFESGEYSIADGVQLPEAQSKSSESLTWSGV